jgi:methanogenic corrinoid protein MtbC1
MEILDQLAACIEYGKSDKNFPHPEHLKGKDGAYELTKLALEIGIQPGEILEISLMTGMQRVGEKFEAGKAFIPNLLISAKAMYAAMEHLKPFFISGEVKHKGTVVLGTVEGDMHDIGKNILKMVMEGDGWNVIDLGTNVSVDTFVKTVDEKQPTIVGLSALLTTTMLNMNPTTKAIKEFNPDVKVFVGGAPLTSKYAEEIGSDGYFPDPHRLIKHINN